jgi:hypothetical protein
MKKVFLKLSDRGVIVSVTYDPVDTARYVSAANVANDRSVCGREPIGACLKLIVVFDRCLDATFCWDLNSHPGQELSRVLKLGEIVFGSTFPEVYVKRLIANDFGASREVDNFAWHD